MGRRRLTFTTCAREKQKRKEEEEERERKEEIAKRRRNGAKILSLSLSLFGMEWNEARSSPMLL